MKLPVAMHELWSCKSREENKNEETKESVFPNCVDVVS